MVRVAIKSGVWKNSEDETLKAAIQKYGQISQWGRIASLLPRKSARQCRARWENWLDPRLRKTEWTREEDEKLLHLAKLMPTQWRTIAPMIGRTAGQCLERYGKLLDSAAGEDGEQRSSEEASAINKLRVGDIDPNPEDKPARPDPVDMDDDEKEMLSEAKARLSNVNGKKAKRKARERLLENARRMAKLQRYRELKAAGLSASTRSVLNAGRNKADRNGIDYASEIPFERSVPAGFYSTEKEVEEGAERFVSSESRKRLFERANEDPHKRAKAERDAMVRDRERFEKLAKSNMEAAMKVIDERNNAFAQITSRAKAKLALPAPQVSDAEMEHIAKLGRVRSVRPELGGASADLVGDYSEQGAHALSKAAEQVRTPVAPDIVMQEARNQRLRTAAATPLQGGVNTTTTGGTGFDGYAPSVQTATTPSVMGSTNGRTLGDRPKTVAGSVATGFSLSSKASSIGLRDHFSINQDGDDLDIEQSEAMVSHEERRAKEKERVAQLRSQLGSLPAPKYSYDIEMTSKQSGKTSDMADQKGQELEEKNRVLDAADEEAVLFALSQKEEQARLESRTMVAKHSLPCPSLLPVAGFAEKAFLAANKSDPLLAQHALRLARADVQDADTPAQESKHNLQRARALIKERARQQFGDAYQNAQSDAVANAFGESLATERAKFVVVPAVERVLVAAQADAEMQSKKKKKKKKRDGATLFDAPFKAVAKASASQDDRLKAARLEFFAVESALRQQQAACKKMRKRSALLVAGLTARVGTAAKGFISTQTKLERSLRDCHTFRHMQSEEDASIPARLAAWRDRVEHMRKEEQRLQSLYFERLC